MTTTLLLLGLSQAPASRAADGLSPHHRELLQARVEDLHRRLNTADTPESLRREGLTVRNLPGAEHRDLAGARIERQPIRVTGQAGHVLRWLDLIAGHRLVTRPPLSIRSLDGPGRPVEADLTIWRATAAAFDPGADDDGLARLRDTLVWLEAGRKETAAALALLDGLADFETVRLEQVAWQDGRLSGRISALDARAADAYHKHIAQLLAELDRPPEFDLRIDLPTAPDRGEPASAQMVDCPVADALLLSTGLAGTELVVLADPNQAISYRANPADAAALLADVIDRASGLRAATFGAVRVLAPDLAPEPPAVDALPEAPVTLRLHRVRPRVAWKQVAAAARTGLLAPDHDRGLLTAALRKRSARQVAGLLAWVQGLTPHPGQGITLLLPAEAESPAPLKRPTVEGPIDLFARRAPLAGLVAGLTGLSFLHSCANDRPAEIDLWLNGAVPARLAADLLAVHQRSLRTDGTGGQGLAIQGPGAEADCPTRPPPSPPPERPTRLAAVMRTAQGPKALLVWPTTWRWVEEDDTLPGGWRMAAIKARRAVLLGPAGQSEQLVLQGRAPLPRSEPTATPGPTRQGLSDLRLAATALVAASRPTALVADREGHLHRVTAGSPIGRRCGRVQAVLPGALDVQLGCARPFEPKQVRMRIGPR